MNTTRRTLTYYAAALVAVVATVVLGGIVQRAAAAEWQPSCSTAAVAHEIQPGDSRADVDAQLGHGQRVLRDQLVTGVAYASCSSRHQLVVLYFRDTHRVASVIWA